MVPLCKSETDCVLTDYIYITEQVSSKKVLVTYGTGLACLSLFPVAELAITLVITPNLYSNCIVNYFTFSINTS